MTTTSYFADAQLALRLEDAEGLANARFVETRARLQPHSGACYHVIADAHVMFDGVDSPCTQTFALGLRSLPNGDAMQQIEDFYSQHGAATHHEISPLADARLLSMLHARQYEAIEQSTVLYFVLKESALVAPSSLVRTRLIATNETSKWVELSVQGWSEASEFAAQIRDLATIMTQRDGVLSFVAEIADEAVATASMFIADGVAVLAGASTVPTARQQGAQSALLHARLHYAQQHGCDVAMMAAAPGSSSQRNAERNGFRVAYTRTKWRKELTPIQTD